MANEPLPRSVLVLNQSTSYRPWPTAIVSQIRSLLNSNDGRPISVYVENLDLYRFSGPRYLESLRDHFREKFRDKPIGVVVAIGPAALIHTLDLRGSLWPDSPLVFAAVDERTAELNPGSHATGVIMQMTVTDMVRVARALLPNVKRFAIVGDQLERQLYYRHFNEEIAAFSRDFEFIDLTGLPLSEVKHRVASLPDHAAILYIGINFVQGTTYVSAELVPEIADAANAPVIVNVETYFGTGAVGGPILSPSEIGREAGELILRVLNGEEPSNIPIITGNSPKPIFDWRQLRRWNISESRLPPGSEVRFRNPGAWEQYRLQILSGCIAIIVQTMLIAWLLYEHRQRRRSEILARETMSELAHVNRIATAGELSASIAHEVTQPLTGIVASANAAIRWLSTATPDVERARAAVNQILRAGYGANEIVRSMRALFKKGSEDQCPVNMNDLILSVLAFTRADLDKSQIKIELELRNHLPLVFCDYVQLQQVVLNLIINAQDSMSSVAGRSRILQLRTSTDSEGQVMVSVHDSGTGIRPENIDRIFKPLFTTKVRGMGMGLSICRSIIEAHHGRVWASSTSQNGSGFQFVLPASGSRN